METNKTYNTRYREKNREALNIKQRLKKREIMADLRERVFQVYGRRCEHCGKTYEKVLTLDHVQNDGAKDRIKNGIRQNSATTYREAAENYQPAKFQILCIDCNWCKGIHGHLPDLDEYQPYGSVQLSEKLN